MNDTAKRLEQNLGCEARVTVDTEHRIGVWEHNENKYYWYLKSDIEYWLMLSRRAFDNYTEAYQHFCENVVPFPEHFK